MKKLLLFWLLFVPVVWGLPSLQVSSPGSLEVYSGVRDFVVLNVSNVGDEDLVDASCKGGFVSSNSVDLGVGESGVLNLSVLANSTFDWRNIDVSCGFFYFSDYPSEAVSFNVSVGDDGFSVFNLTVREGDRVTWFNGDDGVHSVSDFDGGFDVDVNPGDSFSRVFDDVGVVRYYDVNSGFIAYVTVLSRSVPVLSHSADLDEVVVLRLKSFLESGVLSLSYFPSSIVVNAQGVKEDVVKVLNTGDFPVVNVRLGLWQSEFKLDGFSVAPGEEKVISFLVKPNITRTEDTNRSFVKYLFVESDNAPTISVNVSFFVPFADLDVFNFSDDVIYIYPNNDVCVPIVSVFCSGNPDDSDCVKLSRVLSVEKVRFVEAQHTVNLTDSDVSNIREFPNILNRIYNRIKDEGESASVLVDENNILLGKVNDALKVNEELRSENEVLSSRIGLAKVLTVLSLLMVCLGLLAFLIWRRVKSRGLVEDSATFGD